jgi:hypothetical protein
VSDRHKLPSRREPAPWAEGLVSDRHKLMADAALAFLAAARAFRAAYRERDPEDRASARRVRNAVARVYLAAVFLPSHGSADAAPTDPLPLDDALAAIDEALADAIARLEADQPGAVWRARQDFDDRWGSYALDVLEPLHRSARATA